MVKLQHCHPYRQGMMGADDSDSHSPDMLPLEVGRVDPTKGELTTLLALHIPVEPEAEDRVLHQALVHHLVEGWHCTPY